MNEHAPPFGVDRGGAGPACGALFLLVCFGALVVTVLLDGRDDVKAPPASVLPIPAGMTPTGESPACGSGGCFSLAVFLESTDPTRKSPANLHKQMREELRRSGWSETFSGTSVVFAKEDLRVLFDEPSTDRLRFESIDSEGRYHDPTQEIVVTLEYDDFGIGRLW